MPARLLAVLGAIAVALVVIATASASGQQQKALGGADGETAENAIDDAGDTNLGADPEQHHGTNFGHLPPSSENVDLVSRLKVSMAEEGVVADVATYRDTAFLAGWSPLCDTRGAGGFWSLDVRNPRAPRELTFVSSPPGTYLTEGMHAFRLTTPAFTGDVLLVSQEICGNAGTTGRGGIALYDVTNPAAPTLLGMGADTGVRALGNSSHSAFGWDVGNKAYAAAVDNQETEDIDIFDITDPRNPVLIKETGVDEWPQAQDNLAYGSEAFVHDLIVRRVEGRWEMLASYWDVGYVRIDMTDPANPRYIIDHDFLPTDPLVPGIGKPEGNAHEAEWDRCPEEGVRSRFPCGDTRYVLAADEDFSVSRPTFRINSGPGAGFQDAGEFSWTVPLNAKFSATNGVAEGPTRFGGSGCPSDVNGNGTNDRAEVPNASTLPISAGQVRVIVFERGTCFFSEKVETGQLAGYDVVLVANHHAGANGGLFPDAFICGSQGHTFTATVSGLCIGHRALHQLFNDPPEYTTPSTGQAADLPPIGTNGVVVRVAGGVFDGWGYVHLLNHDTMAEIDQYAVPQALDERFAQGFGDLTVHEITTDPTGDVGYLAWYSAGFRVVDYSGGTLEEVGHFIAPEGSDIWGVELNVRRDGRLFALASDRSYGLYIFRFGTDLRTTLGGSSRGTVGRTLNLNARVKNDGTIGETRTRWTTTLPRGLRALRATSSQGRCTVSGRRVTCNLGLLRDDATASVSIRVRASSAGTKRITAFVNGVKAEYDVGNNTARKTVRIAAARTRGGGGPGLTGRRP